MSDIEPERAIELVQRLSSQLPTFPDAMDTLVVAGILPRGAADFAAIGTNRRELLPNDRYRAWHAEQDALSRFVQSADGTPVIVVVTLEPCGSRTRGPPVDRIACCKRIVDFSERCPVERVVAGFFDGGVGTEMLLQNGIPVTLLHGPAHKPGLRDGHPDPMKFVTELNGLGYRATAEVVQPVDLDDTSRERLKREGERARECRASLAGVLTVLNESEQQGIDGAAVVAQRFADTFLEGDVAKMTERLVTWRSRRGAFDEALMRLIRGCVERQWEKVQRAAILTTLRERRARE